MLLLRQSVCFVPVMEVLCQVMQVCACADVRAIPQLDSETGLKSRGLFILKCLVKWKEDREEMPSQLSSQLGMYLEV